MQINMDRITAMATEHLVGNQTVRNKMTKKLDEYMLSEHSGGSGVPNVSDAGFKFANVLLHTIYSQSFSDKLAAALEDIEVSEPFKIGEGHYGIYIYFDGDLTRDSMSTKKAYYSINLADLYNDGVDHTMQPIFEWEDGRLRRSRTVIPYTGFIEQAIDDFLGNYGSEYNVIRLERGTGIF